jgi:hypothetical protein
MIKSVDEKSTISRGKKVEEASPKIMGGIDMGKIFFG